MALPTIFRNAYWSLAIAGGLYFICMSLLLNGWIQRHALYAHRVQTTWLQDPKTPEQFGFLKNQVRPFNVTTPDGETLFAWHILPLALYAKHETLLVDEVESNSVHNLAFSLLARDPESRVVISFHGNAGTVAQGWRTDIYRAVSSGASDKIHVLAVDYRGFGYSTGFPTEAGVIMDGAALVDWALGIAKIRPERIVILGHSLGTAVSTAVAEFFVTQRQVEFAGIILVAAFSDIPTLMLTYSIGGIIPILSPMRPYPMLQRYFVKHIQDTWQTSIRLANLVRKSQNVDVNLIHAQNDYEIPWKHSDALFYAAANATSKQGISIKEMDAAKTHLSLGKSGWVNSWTAAGPAHGDTKKIRLEIVASGGHNRLATYPAVAKAVLRSFHL